MAYKCEIEGCDWSGAIRSKVKNHDSEHYGKKVCPAHAQENRVYSVPKTPTVFGVYPTKPKKRIKQMTEKTRQKRKERSEIRNKYFEYHIERCQSSEESGVVISEPTRANICHIFDKGRHPSLQANIDNCIYLTLNEHTRFDQLLYTFRFEEIEKEFPNSWKNTCEKIKALLPLCREITKFRMTIEGYLK